VDVFRVWCQTARHFQEVIRYDVGSTGMVILALRGVKTYKLAWSRRMVNLACLLALFGSNLESYGVY
jgi:hypothetical protein